MPQTAALQWLSLVGAIWLQSISGTNMNFPAYSSQFKHILSMSQIQLNNLAFASDSGKLFGWFSGIAAVYLPLWLVLVVGSVLGLIGYGFQYLSLINQIPALPYPIIFFLTAVAGNSICWINTVSYIVSIKNFPANQQVAVGISTSYQGLSAKVYGDIVGALFSPASGHTAKDYLLLNSVLPLIVCFVCCPLVRDIDAKSLKNVNAGFVAMFAVTIATGVYSVIGSLDSISGGMSNLENLIGTGVLLLAPLLIPLAARFRDRLPGKLVRTVTNRENRVHIFTIDEVNGGGGDDDAERSIEERFKEEEIEQVQQVQQQMQHQQEENAGVRKQELEEIGAMVMLKRVDFWLYFFVYFCGATIGLVFLNNLGQIAESRGSSRTSSLVSLSSSFSFFGRLMPSLLDYFLSRTKYMVSGPGLIAVSMAPMGGAFFLLLNPTDVCLYISTAIIGVCTGAITSISVSTTRDLFGTKYFSVNHNVLVANIPIGSFLFGYLAAVLYRREGNGDDGVCMGMDCYRTTFIIWGCVSSLGIVFALILYSRTRKFYPAERSYKS